MKRGDLVISEAGQVEQVMHPICARCFVHRTPYQLRLLHAKIQIIYRVHWFTV
jgi:hypothetical protein